MSVKEERLELIRTLGSRCAGLAAQITFLIKQSVGRGAIGRDDILDGIPVVTVQTVGQVEEGVSLGFPLADDFNIRLGFLTLVENRLGTERYQATQDVLGDFQSVSI